MRHQEVINQNIIRHGTSFERKNVTNWYNMIFGMSYFRLLLAIAILALILTLIPLGAMLCLMIYSNLTEIYVSGHKFLGYFSKGIAPLNYNLLLQSGKQICDSTADGVQFHETYLEYYYSRFVLFLAVIILVVVVVSNVIHGRLSAEIKKMQGRLIRYEDLLNNEGKLHAKFISEIPSGSSKRESLGKDSQVTDAKMACKRDSADANLEMDYKKENNEKRKQYDDIIQMILSETLGLETGH
ncbi:hypothetical protein EAE96_003653 [Botrytis aclada]|nr:hypothetical protein EAE96_003653 [Botrytis aclada]